MNRKQRRETEKSLGLRKHYNKQTRKERWERIRDNIENGKYLMQEAKKNIISKEEEEEIILNSKIARKAEKIAKQKGIPMVDAMVEAGEILNKN